MSLPTPQMTCAYRQLFNNYSIYILFDGNGIDFAIALFTQPS